MTSSSGVYNPKYQYHGDKVDFRQKHSLKLMSFLPHQPLNIKSSNTPGRNIYLTCYYICLSSVLL